MKYILTQIKLLFERKADQKFRYYIGLLGIIFGFLFLYFQGLPNKGANHSTICLIKNITGYPCPTCGTTRSLKYLCHLHIKESFLMNPTGILVGFMAAISFFWIIRDLIKNDNSFNRFFSKKIHWSLVVLIVIYLIFNEIWNIQKGF